MSEGEIITRRRKWSLAQKSALLDEVEAENGKVAAVARRHGISESLLYNCSAWKSTACAVSAPEPVDFVPLGVLGEVNRQRRPLLAPPKPERPQPPQAGEAAAGMIEIALPNGIRICVGGSVSSVQVQQVFVDAICPAYVARDLSASFLPCAGACPGTGWPRWKRVMRPVVPAEWPSRPPASGVSK